MGGHEESLENYYNDPFANDNESEASVDIYADIVAQDEFMEYRGVYSKFGMNTTQY